MIDASFYKSIAPLGDHVPAIYKRLESAILFIIGQVYIYEIDMERFVSLKDSKFESDLNRVRSLKSPVPSENDLQKFSLHIKVINDSMVGKGVRYQMVVTSALVKLFFSDNV